MSSLPGRNKMMGLPPALYAYLLDIGRTAPLEGISPRALLGPRARPQKKIQERLALAGFLKKPLTLPPSLAPEFQKVANVLRAPKTAVTLRIWSRENWTETHLYFPSSIAVGRGIALNQSNGLCQLTKGIEPRDVITLVTEGFLGLAPDHTPMPFEARLDLSEAAVFFAVLDLDRAEYPAIMEGAKPTGAWSGPEIIQQIQDSWTESPSARYLGAVALASMAGAPEETTLNRARATLTTAGMLETRGDRFAPAGILKRLLPSTLEIEAGFQWQRLALTGDQVQLNSRVVLLSDQGLLLSIDRSPGAVFVQSITRPDLTDWFVDQVSPKAG